MSRFRRGSLARNLFVACAVLVVVPLASPRLAGAVSEGVASEVADPRALSAPKAPAPIVMDCVSGAVDVNIPDPDALAGLTNPEGGPLSRPVRERIVEGQPYLQPRDLLAVPGITRAHLEAWQRRGLACATPPTLPPPSPNPCTPGQLDLNDAADRDGFASLYGRPTADRIVSGIPYPSVVNALRVAGVGPGRIAQTADRVCATPYPVRHASVDWAWANPDTGIAFDNSGDFGTYTLTIPAGVTEGTGAWGSLDEAESSLEHATGLGSLVDLETPGVDAHIHAPWSGVVGVTLPADPTDVGDGYVNAVVHYASDGAELHANDGIAVGDDGRLTVAVDELSFLDSVQLAANWVAGVGRAAVRLAAQAEQVWRAAIGAGGPPVTCSPDLTHSTLPDGERFAVDGQLLNNRPLTPPLTHCVTRSHGEAASPDARFGVNRGIVNVLDSRSGVAVHDVSRSGTLLWALLGGGYNNWATANGKPLYLAPGTTFSAHPSAYRGSFHIETSLPDYLLVTAGYWITGELSTFVPSGVAKTITSILTDHPECAYQFGSALGALAHGDSDGITAAITAGRVLFECFVDALKSSKYLNEPLDVLKWFIPNPTVGQAQDAFVFMERLKRASAMLQAAKWATVIADAALITGVDGNVEVSWRPPEPPTPTVDAQGRSVDPDCVSKTFNYDTGWVVTIDETCQDLAHGEFGSGATPPVGPPVDAFDDWVGEITSLRMYNVLRRDSAGVLHLILLEGGELVAHPIARGDEWSFKEDWPEDEWRSAEFAGLIDKVGTPAVNDPLRLRFHTEGRGHSWLLRDASGTAWYIDPHGIRHRLPTVDAQQAVSNNVLTLHPAQYTHDICPYPQPGDTGLRVC